MTPQELNERLESLYNSAEAATSEGLADQAIQRCEAALELLDLNFDEECTFTHGDFLMLAGNACWEEGDIEGALRYYRRANEMDPDRLDALVAIGVGLFHLCRFAAAKAYIELASVEDPDCGEAWYYLALCSLREGDTRLARIFFERASQKEPDRWLLPVLLDEEEIHRLVEQMFALYPPEIQESLGNVAIVLEPMPSEDLLHSCDPPLDPLLLGLFTGVPLPERSTFSAETELTQIHLFTYNIALVAGSRERLLEELAVTLKHEIGHFLGLDEDDLEERGLD
ncbi:MAG: metallopeptidase family protein [Candidatus Sumerlaeia bacterium]|nr:metallopeptidase family protein [Candidatus Sumerlaeia bacterium]